MRRLTPALLAVLAGCATIPVHLAYAPGGLDAPVSDRAARVYVADVVSRIEEILFDGNSRARVFKPQRPLADIARDAVVVELKRTGFATAAGRQGADRLMSVTVNKAGVGWPPGANVECKASIDMTVVIKDGAGRVLWYGDIKGEATEPIALAGFPGRKPEAALNKALADAVRKARAQLEAGESMAKTSEPPQAGSLAASPAVVASDVDELPSPRAQRKAHAVVIGIERYRESLPAADFAVGDAKLAAEYFKRVFGVPAENVALLTDDRATNVDFQKHFERWLPNRVKEGDEVYVYFSGHGSPNPVTGDGYMVPYDGDPTYLEQTGYSLKRMYDQLAKLPAKRVIVAMDSCFSGAGGRSVMAKGARPLVATMAASSLPANVTVIAASGGDQISNSYQEKGRGLFTYYFLKGLKEKGPDLKSVYGYLKPEVARVAREKYNADQDPQWREGK